MLKVLLVDDEPFIVQGLSALIDWEKEGFEIVGTAGNGSEAVEFLKSNPVDLILAGYQNAGYEWSGIFKIYQGNASVRGIFCNTERLWRLYLCERGNQMAVYGLHIKADPEKPAPCTAFKGKTDAAG